MLQALDDFEDEEALRLIGELEQKFKEEAVQEILAAARQMTEKFQYDEAAEFLEKARDAAVPEDEA